MSDEDTRQRRIMENQRLLSSLGIHSGITAIHGESSSSVHQNPSGSSGAQRKRRDTASQPKYDRSGYIISLPPPGQRQRMAAVEIPSDRKLMRSIADGEYQDCSWWGAGEARRRRFGHGESNLELGEQAVVGGVGPDFRWRKWKGLSRELRSELKKRKEVDQHDRGERLETEGEVSSYSVSRNHATYS